MVINDELSQKIVLIVDKEIHLEEAGDGFFLKTRLLKDRKVHEDYALNIGGEEGELVNIPSAFSLGSGFFIAENIIATAAHVPLEANRYKNISIDNIRFIDCFCYPIKDEMKEGNDIFIPKDRIFKPMVGYENLPSFEYTGRGQDWAFIPVETISGDPVDHTYIKPDFKPVTKKDKVTWFGHPLGLPVATIKDNKVLKVT